MPSRVLRDWTDSDRVEQLSAEAERLYVRLIMKADDYGRYFADAKRLKAYLFPLKDDVPETDISRWLAECERAGLLRFYAAADKQFLELWNFKQRLRAMRSVHPAPPDDRDLLTDDSHPPTDARRLPSSDRNPPPDSDSDSDSDLEARGKEKVETERDSPPALLAEAMTDSAASAFAEGTTDKGDSSPTNVQADKSAEALAKVENARHPYVAMSAREILTEEQALAQTVAAGIPPDFVSYVHADWSSRNGRDASGSVVTWLPYVIKRWTREQEEWRGGIHRGRKGLAKPGRPEGVPTNAEVQAYAREKWSDDDRALNWAVSFHVFWNDPKRNWQRQGRRIDWPIEFSQQVAKWRSG